MNVVIYARFSCKRQTEQSIEGQLKICYDYAAAHKYNVVGEYIDRAQSGTSDNRTDFQRMIADSEKRTFEGVLVYQLDRFARNRYDSAIYKAKLKKNGVRVFSAKENITEDASGILVEGLLESMAEYYSVELAQKINRGLALNAEKCLSNGSNPGLGYKVNKKDRTFYIDEAEAEIVREIYERYARGEPKTEIIRDLNRRQIKTSIGNPFSLTSLTRLLSNKRYIGYYLYSGKETPGGMPRIIEDDLYYRVQEILERNRHAQAKTTGEDAYILTTKLFCGHCKEMMIGVSGTGKSGMMYYYYACKGARKKSCNKKSINKQFIENLVIDECLKLLTDERMQYIAKKVSDECSRNPDNMSIKYLKSSIKEIDDAIENMWISIEKGGDAVSLTERINRRQEEKERLEAQLAEEQNKRVILTEAQVLAFLNYVCELPGNDMMKRRAIINIFVHSIYLYDDHLTLIINGSNKPVTVDDIPFDDIEATFNGEKAAMEQCSHSSDIVPPNKSQSNTDSHTRNVVPPTKHYSFISDCCAFLFLCYNVLAKIILREVPIMAGIYIGIILLFRIVQALFSKRSSNEIRNITMMVGDSAFRNTISSILGLVLIIVAGKGFKADFITVLIAVFSGLCLFISGCCSTYAMKSGTVSLNSMFGTAGMIIPIIAGAVMFNQPISVMQIAGLTLFFLSAYLLIGASKTVYSNFSYKTILLLIGSMVSNGGTMFAQQMFTHFVPDGDISVFSFISFGVIAILAGVAYFTMSSKRKSDESNTKLPKALKICGIALALAVFVINQLATASTRLVSPVILFTFINGGGTIISTLVAAIVYKEKLSLKTIAGVLTGIVSLVVIKLFQY